MENYPNIICHMSLMSNKEACYIVINISCDIICFRVLLAHRAVCQSGIILESLHLIN